LSLGRISAPLLEPFALLLSTLSLVPLLIFASPCWFLRLRNGCVHYQVVSAHIGYTGGLFVLNEYPALTRMFADALLTTTVTVHSIRVARGWRVLRTVPNNSVPPHDELLFVHAPDSLSMRSCSSTAIFSSLLAVRSRYLAICIWPGSTLRTVLRMSLIALSIPITVGCSSSIVFS